jgi:putative tricarboxylic transport membrane protein
VLGVILGPMIEDQLNRALLIARNDWTVLLRRPISLMFLCMAVLSIVFSVVSVRRSTKQSVAASS